MDFLRLFEYEFMRRAFIAGIMIAVALPCVGVVIVQKRMSMIGDALSHTSLVGVAAGLLAGFNPVVGAVLACVAGALAIEAVRQKVPENSDLSITVVMAAGIGLAGVLSGFVKTAANFNSFLFGSIVAIGDSELVLVIAVSAATVLLTALFYKELFLYALDERAARLAGVPVGAVRFSFTVLTALTVSVASRTAGALVVSSLMVLPVACAMRIGKSYLRTVIYSACFAAVFMAVGLALAGLFGLRPGGAVVLAGVACYVIMLAYKRAVC